MEQVVNDYRFDASHLAVAGRRPGISAFMRIRNGADFLEPVIRSHIDHLDEIVAVYNQCTDATPAILERLQSEYGRDRLRIFHYRPRVYPPGSAAHAATPPDSVHSVVNYSNFALAQTRRRTVLKLDDDHLAHQPVIAELTARLPAEELRPNHMACIAGINIRRDPNGRYGIASHDPLVGLGDHGFFRIGPESRYAFDPRFERLRPSPRRVFAGFGYWHLKYLKAGEGFANYEIETAGNARFERHRARFDADRSVIGLEELKRRGPPAWLLRVWRRLGIRGRDRAALLDDVWCALRSDALTRSDVEEAIALVTAHLRRRPDETHHASPKRRRR